MNIHCQMTPWLGMIDNMSSAGSNDGPVAYHAVAALLFYLFWFGVFLATWLGIIFLIHFLFSLPLRRAERARLFLDLLEDALRRGQRAEDLILSVARTRDRMVGVRFHILATHIENGLSFAAALQKAPRFLPPQIAAMLAVGERLGDLRRVLPAARELLRDRPAGVRSAKHYLMLVVLIFSPVFIFFVMMTSIYVIPRFKDVAAGMNARMSPETLFVFNHVGWLVVIELMVALAILAAVLLYVGGPQLARWIQFRAVPVADWIAWRLPWKHKRLQRTFSAMLTTLLDGGVPEAEAVRLAGDCTANEICRRRARRSLQRLAGGARLDEAVRDFDDAGELRWRLANALHGRAGFLAALRGWHEALDARAFQQEETAAHLLTTGVVILNGLLVALIATGLFGVIIALLRGTLATT